MQKFNFFLLTVLPLIGSLANADGYGFRDLKIGSPVSAFQNHCQEKDTLFDGLVIIKGLYTCYELEDLKFKLIRPAGSSELLDPEAKVEWFQVQILEPFMLTLNGEDLNEALSQEARFEWAEAKVAALIEEFKQKYQLTWSWDDPRFPERKKRILKEFKSKKNALVNRLETVFDDGKVSVALEESAFAPNVIVTYRNQEYSDSFLRLELRTNKYTAPPKSADLSEF